MTATVHPLSDSIRSELAEANREVNAAFDHLPEEHRPNPAAQAGLDRELDAACASGDTARARAAIRAWRGYWLAEFKKAAI